MDTEPHGERPVSPTKLPSGSRGAEHPAGPWIRALARVFDVVIVAGAAVILWSVVAMVVEGLLSADLADYDVITGVVLAVALSAYFVWFEYAEGQTMGKQMLRLRTVGPDGDGPTPVQALRRNGFVVAVSAAAIVAALVPVAAWAIVGAVGGAVAVYAAAVGVTIASGPDRRGMHDRFAGGTEVVRYPKP